MKTPREQRRRPAAPDPSPPTKRGEHAHGGSPLPAATQAHMGAAFGHDFSAVRVFADEAAAESAEQMGARAYTVGSDIFFNHGFFDPQGGDGRALLAHELTHVVQRERNGGAAGGPGGVSDPADASEREASALARRAAAGQRVTVQAAPTATASRGLLGWIEGEASGAAQAVSSATHAVGGAVSSATHAVGHAAGAAWDGAKGVASEVGHTVGHVASEVGHTVSHAATEAGHAVGHVASEAGHAVMGAGHAAGHFAAEMGQRVGHGVSEVGHHIGHGVSEAEHWVGHEASEVGHRVSHVASEVGHRVGHVASEVGHTVGHAASVTGHAVGDAASSVYGGMKTAGGWVRQGEEAVGHGIDWAEDHEKAATAWAANHAKGIPGLEQVADAGKAYLDTTTELTGGVARGATGLVGGVAGMVVNPVDTARGLEAMGEHIPGIGGTGLKAAHGLLNVAMGDETMAQLGHSLSPEQSLKDDGQFWKTVGGGLVGQYSDQWHQGKYADVIGHAGFDIGSLFLGAGEANAASKLGEASRLAEAAKIGDAAKLGDAADLGKVADAAKLDGVADVSKADAGLAEHGYRPPPGERATTREEYQAERHAERQADFEQFRAEKTDALAGQNLSPEELQSAIGQARRRTQVRDGDVHRMRYNLDAPTGRMAEIDERTGANYQRLLQEQMAQEPFQYRYTNRRMAGIYEDAGKIDRPTFMSDSRFESNAQSMDKAQVAEDWGVHQVGMQIPTSEVVDARVPRPFGNSPHVKSGWEPHTNSYPEYGSGGALQYLGKTERYDPAWAYDLTDDFARRGATGTPVAADAAKATEAAPTAVGLSPGAEGVKGLSGQADEAALLHQPGGGGHVAEPPVGASSPKSPQQHLLDEAAHEHQDLQRRAGLSNKDPEYLSRKQQGPNLTSLLDMDDPAAQVSHNLNDPAGKIPAQMPDFYRERIEAQKTIWDEQSPGLLEKERQAPESLTPAERGILHAGDPGSHSEVHAVANTLMAREARTGVAATEEDLSRLLLHNTDLTNKFLGQAKPRCFNCGPITEGVSLTEPLQEVDGPFRRLFTDPHEKPEGPRQ